MAGALSGSGAISVKTDGGSTMTDEPQQPVGNAAVGSGACAAVTATGSSSIRARAGSWSSTSSGTSSNTRSVAISVDAGEHRWRVGQGGHRHHRQPDQESGRRAPLQAINLIAGIGWTRRAARHVSRRPSAAPSSWRVAVDGGERQNRIEGDWFPTGAEAPATRCPCSCGSPSTFHLPGLAGDPATFLTGAISITSADGTNFASGGPLRRGRRARAIDRECE